MPIYYADVFSSTVSSINSESNHAASFIFITDTHVNANRMKSPFLIKNIVGQTHIDKVIWGGDAIAAYGNKSDIEAQWMVQMILDTLVSKVGKLYKIRGNHDFTIKESRSSAKGVTYSQEKTAQILLKNHPDDIVLNEADPGACYYYFDDKKVRIRFVAFDTTDSVKAEDVAWGTVYGVRDVQLQWIADSAIATTPKGYGIVFLSHIPFIDITTSKYAALINAKNLIDAATFKAKGKIGTINYDFTKLENVRVMMVVSGHNHKDMQTFRNGVVHMVTASDAAYNDYKEGPFVKDLTGRKRGTVNEQCFDAVIINRKRCLIKAYRFGVGGDRLFHTKPLLCKIGKKKHLKTKLQGNVEWNSYNALGNEYSNGKWTLFNDVVSVDKHGYVTCQKRGEAVVLAIDEKGNKEFYNIIVNM